MLKIGVVAGEPSGDFLGSQLIAEIKKKHPDTSIVGIGGEQLIAQGCHSLFDMERLSVTGISEIFWRIFEILNIRKKLTQYFLSNPPDIFIGIDAPEFNLTLEEDLRKNGIKVVHYVSPSVWAWREYRIKKISRAVDIMLAFLPFEIAYYQSHNIPVQLVRHPLVDKIMECSDQATSRQQLGLPAKQKIIALMPGSRNNELKQHTEIFLQAALACQNSYSEPICFITNALNRSSADKINHAIAKNCPDLNTIVFTGNSTRVIAASDLLLVASGTITLEAMFLEKPMIVAYRCHWLSYQIVKKMKRVPYIALPNLLSKQLLVPECIQNNCTAEILSKQLLTSLNNTDAIAELKTKFHALNQTMFGQKEDAALQAVLSLIDA